MVAHDKPYPPPTPKEKRKKGNVYENLTPIVLYDVTLVHENKDEFSLVNHFVDYFVNSDWLE